LKPKQHFVCSWFKCNNDPVPFVQAAPDSYGYEAIPPGSKCIPRENWVMLYAGDELRKYCKEHQKLLESALANTDIHRWMRQR
jgi:hypothetical protein